MIADTVIIIGLIIGAVLLLASAFVLTKHGTLPFGGVAVAGIGMVLLGLSIWQSVDLSVGTDGVSAKLTQDIGGATADVNQKVSMVERKVAELKDLVLAEHPKTKTSSKLIVAQNKKEKILTDNSKYSVLVFYRPEHELAGRRLSDAFLSAGYRSSSTETGLTEASQQFPSKTIWIVYSETGKRIIDTVAKILQSQKLDFSIVAHPQAHGIRRGDVQLLLF